MKLLIFPVLFLPFLRVSKCGNVQTPSWADVCGGSFLFSEVGRNWEDAAGECALYGGHLAIIQSVKMNYCLLEHAHSAELASNFYWHGANDLESEGVYRQADGSILDWQPNWYDTEPAGGTGENCLGVMLDNTNYAGKWFDDSCTKLHPYICEREI